MLRHRCTSILLVFGLALAGCEGERNNSSWSTAKPGDAIVPSLATTKPAENPSTTPSASPAPAATAAAGASGRGVGPVDKVDIASLDGARALAGSQLFVEKCSACHKLAERYIGPALAGITERRQPEWILNMILNPEVMIQQDPTAKALLAEYLAPMANQHLTRDQAESVLAYFLQQDNGAQPASVETSSGGSSQPVAQK